VLFFSVLLIYLFLANSLANFVSLGNQDNEDNAPSFARDLN